MARLQGVRDGEGGILARIAFWYSRRKLGRVVTPVRVYALHPRLLRGYGNMEMTLEKTRMVEARLKLLAAVKVATRVGCPF